MFSENRLDGVRNNEEAVQPATTEPELRQREAELKRRYEDPYRREQAKIFRNRRNHLREQEKRRMEELAAQLTSSVASSEEVAKGESAQFVQSNEHLLRELQTVEQQKANLLDQQRKRGLFERLKYVFVQDPFKSQIESLLQDEVNHRAEIEANLKKIANVNAKWQVHKEKGESTLKHMTNGVTKSFQEERRALLEKVRSINRSSRESIRNTFLSMEAGELDIAKLAKENNAVVVHAIPLDGWSMKNTSMNNQEVDVENLTAKEKSALLVSKKPDVSASILSAGEIVAGQNMFYPFGFIIDGKLIASYEGDEGTYADGDMRRKKEYEGATLAKDTQNRFTQFSKTKAKESQGGQYNESIVHNPTPKGILIDEQVLSTREDLGDEVTEYYSPEEEDQIRTKFADKIVSTAKGTPTKGPYAGRAVFRLTRKRSPVEKAIEFAQQNHPELPVYVRRESGVYTLDGKKVTANDIYS